VLGQLGQNALVDVVEAVHEHLLRVPRNKPPDSADPHNISPPTTQHIAIDCTELPKYR
jgi:hypothetical protein